ncbi:MAG: GHKL domain-containing protein [Candidatus Fimimorpha sp.]
MNYLNLIFRICADELYFFTFMLFIDSKVSRSYFRTSFLFFQIVILFHQIRILRTFPFVTILLIIISTIYIKLIWKHKLRQCLWIDLQFIITHYLLSFIIGVILFFVDFYNAIVPSHYQNFIYHNAEYYSLKDIFVSCIASIILMIWLSRMRLKQLRCKNHYDPMTYTVLFVIATSIFILTYLFLYGTKHLQLDDIILISVIFVVSILLVMLWIVNKIVLTIQNQYALEQQLRKNEMDRNYYDAISDSLSRLSKLRHDFKNYLVILQQYLLDGNYTSAFSFISEISEKTVNPLKVIMTGNQTISAILNTKQDDCQKNNIDFDISIDFDRIFTLTDLDLVALFGNLLDNAITASKKLDNDKRYIHLSITQIDSHLCILCENKFNGEIKEKNGKLISTKDSSEHMPHGIGMSNMEEVIMRNNGNWRYHYTDHLFTVEIMIPNYN